jgi:hypothetical protein
MSWASQNRIGMVCGQEIKFEGIPNDVGLCGFVCNAHGAYGIMFFNMILVHFLKSVTHHRGTFHFVGVLTASFLQAPPNANCICKESKWPVTCIYRISYSRVPYQCWPFQSVVSVACLFPALSMRIALAKKIIGL